MKFFLEYIKLFAEFNERFSGLYSSWMYNFTCPSLIRFDQSHGNYDENTKTLEPSI